MKILIADDDEAIRIFLTRTLQNWEYQVVAASNGSEAWDILKKGGISFVITDWMMPVMDGIDLCRQIRNAGFTHYVYIIILTAKDAKNELVEGLESGADDFVVKPFVKEELKARIKAGERILNLEVALENRNRELNASNKKLSEAYSVIERDLKAGANIQFSLLPKPDLTILGFRFSWLFFPSAFLAGDIFNYFKLDDTHVGFYLLDVAGHGIPAALLSVTLSRMLSPANMQENMLRRFVPEPPHYELFSPARVIHNLNLRFQANEDIMQYFTIIYGIADTKSGHTRITRAGHPPPIHLKEKGETSLVGSNGFPVGVSTDADFKEHEFYLKGGDRFVLYSDGITECTNRDTTPFSVERLTSVLSQGRVLSLKESLGKVGRNLKQWRGNDTFEDDVSLVAFEVT